MIFCARPRLCQAADVDPEGVLLITGSEKADKIIISAGVEDGTVILRGVPGVAKNTVYTGVTAIVVDARGGNDDIRIGSNIRGVGGGLIGVTVNAGTGNDRVEGGDGDDTIRGGGGNDDVRGENGDDVCFGDSGRDVLRGGSDDDYDDDDGLQDEDDEDEGENDGGGGDSAGATTITFSGNAAQVSGTSAGKHDKVFYVFTAPTTGLLSVALQPGEAGRYADLELEDVLASVDLLELEPSEGGPTSGTANVTSGRQYRMRLRSPDLTPVSYTVDLSIAPAT